MKYKSQGQDTTCFPVALVNCGIYKGIKLNLRQYIKMGHCESGAVIGANKLVLHSELPLKKTNDFDLVCKNGGILAIMHPICNLHAVFIQPIDDPDHVLMVNSWLGPNEYVMDKKTLQKFLPSEPNNKYYCFES